MSEKVLNGVEGVHPSKIEFPNHSPIGMTKLTKGEMEAMSTNDITVVSAFLGDKEGSQVPGYLTGYAHLSEPAMLDGKPYEYIHFFMCIKNPVGTTNNVQNIELCRVDDVYGSFLLHHTNRAYGSMGFWMYTPTKTLEGDDLKCRLFIKQLQAASRQFDFKKRVLPAIKNIAASKDDLLAEEKEEMEL